MTLPAQVIEFGDWLPDLAPLKNPGAITARNVVPKIDGNYCSLNDLASFSNALGNVCLGAFWMQGSDNVIYNFAGDIDSLYRLDGSVTWTDVGQVYSAVTNWEFAKFGDRCIAVADGENPQYYDVGVSASFADLPGSPPVAARIAVIRDFVMLGDLETAGPNFVQWSGFNSSELWTASRATQSDSQQLFGRGGRVQRIVPGEYAVIFQEHSIHRADYVGPPVIFQFDEVERGRGTPAAGSVCWTGNLVFYLAHDGFYVFDGVRSTPIGANRVNRWFAANADTSALDSMRGVVDRRNALVMWAFKSSSSLAQNDRIIMYNWTADKWAYAEVDTQCLAEYVTGGFTLDQLDTPLPNGIDTDSINVDSDAFKGGALSLMAFNSSNQAATFSGDPLPATIDTRELRGEHGKRLFANGVRPLIDGVNASCSVSVGRRNEQAANVDFSPARAVDSRGLANIRYDARYHRYRVETTGGFDNAVGVEVHGKMRGTR